jgi:hypothetical protein
VYPDYRYPPRGQKRKGATSGKAAASAASSETSSAIEAKGPAIVPEFGKS